jgi:ribose-phosphate pyrophosphokinase
VILFALPRHARLAETLDGPGHLARGRCAIERFANGELHATLDTGVGGEDCAILGSVAPPDEDLLSTLLLAHTLRKEGARSITAVLPYLGYARQDREERGKSLAVAWIGSLLQASGVDRVVTIDVHSSAAAARFPIPLRSLSPAAILGRAVAGLGDPEATIVAPDQGARERCEAVRRQAGIARPVAHFTKTRTAGGVTHGVLAGAVGRTAIIVDDILDTGGTLASACAALRGAGVADITVMVSHGLFTGTSWTRLWALGVRHVYCLDTMPLPSHVEPARIAVLPAGPLLAGALRPVPATAPRAAAPARTPEGGRGHMKQFTLGEDTAAHTVGDTQCPACWEGYPETCRCGGLIHAVAEAEEDADGNVALITQCDLCGRSEEQLAEEAGGEVPR